MYNINEELKTKADEVEEEISKVFKKLESIREYNQLKVLNAFRKNKVASSDFSGTTGYGYGDSGREKLDLVYADVFGAEKALVRMQIVNGTQALAICFYGNLRPSDELICATGKPYDTLEEVIGLRGAGMGSLKEFDINTVVIPLLDDGAVDIKSLIKKINKKTKMVYLQKSMGYSWRKGYCCDELEIIIKEIKNIKKDIIVLVDNCYGEFVEKKEPTEIGADLVAGSLIKNPGGALAPTGGYVAGKAEYVERAGYMLTSPGIGSEVGATLDLNRLLFQGLFMAPHVVCESLKGAVFAAAMFKKLGFTVIPEENSQRTDIIQAVRFDKEDLLVEFCQGLQKGSPVDSHIKPYPWEMPGYEHKVIMAAGTFIQGASIELTADAPIKKPYIAYVQGGIVYEAAKYGILMGIEEIYTKITNY